MPIRASRAVGLVLPFVCAAFPSLSVADTSGIPHQRVAFVSSASGSPVFGDWPEAGDSLTGLEAADSICVNLASQAGLPAPGDFVAWLSDSSDDAYCRIHNLNGKKSTNCGQGVLPESAGPWERTDQTPWAPEAPLFLHPDSVVFTPLRFDEHSNAIDLSARVWTGTTREGGFEPLNSSCGDWTAAPDEFADFGAVQRTSASWTDNGVISCQTEQSLHLYCLETFSGPSLDPFDPAERLAFVTSDFDNGLLGDWDAADPDSEGVEAGDSICNNLADVAGLPGAGTYKAWLSDVDVAAPNRFEHDGPWYRPDGIRIADGMADLIDGELLTSINVTEEMDYLSSSSVWTGTNHPGTQAAHHCNSWASNDSGSYFGIAGTANSAANNWTQALQSGCGSTFRLYCLSDALPNRFFTEGFETQ